MACIFPRETPTSPQISILDVTTLHPPHHLDSWRQFVILIIRHSFLDTTLERIKTAQVSSGSYFIPSSQSFTPKYTLSLSNNE